MTERATMAGGEVQIAARGLSKSFGGHRLLRDITIDLRRGQVVVLRGENGSGKTTLLNILTGNLAPDSGELELSIGSVRDRFRWPLRWWQRLDPLGHFTPERVARAGLGRVWQDIRLFGTFTVEDNVTIASANRLGEHPLTAVARYRAVRARERKNLERARQRLTKLGLGERLSSSCDRLSLGQMKRAAIARVVQAGARVILLDEPLAGLDEPGQAEVLRHLRRLAASGELAIVIVEHLFNLEKMLALATDVWTLAGGRIELERPEQVTAELAAQPSCRPDPLTVLGGQGDAERGTPRLEVQDLVVKRGLRRVFDGFSLRLTGGGPTLLSYPNGWGKTTLLDAIAGLAPIVSGRILLDGEPLTRLGAWQRSRQGISYLRSAHTIVPSFTVAEHLALSRGRGGRENLYEASARWRSLMPPRDRRAALLSGGEKQRLALGCLPLGKVLLLDEPFLNLDAEAIDALVTLLDELNRPTLVATPS